VVLDLLILGSEIGGVAVALQLVSGISFRYWAIPVGFPGRVLLWLRTVDFVEKAVSSRG
jgi:hypothetical protein